MFYFVWIPIHCLSIFLMSWISCKSDDSWKWFWYLFLTGAIFQMWPLVSRYTNNIVFDAILYDFISVMSWTLSLMYFSGTKFNLYQWFGFLIVLIGLFFVQKH